MKAKKGKRNLRAVIIRRSSGKKPKPGVLERAEERRLIRRWQRRGDQFALSKLVRANAGLVYSIALPYSVSHRLDDLMQEGNIGLVKAIDKFDLKRGTKLSTYAAYWIRSYIGRFVSMSRSQLKALTTNNVRRVLSRLTQTKWEVERELKREHSIEDIAKAMKVKVKYVQTAEAVSRPMVQLDKLLGTMDGSGYHLELVSPGLSPEDQVAEAEDRKQKLEALQRALETLDGRDLDIITERFLQDCPNSERMTLQQMGKAYGICRERIRQLQNSALERLKQHMRGQLH
mgnify:CR=1 FL=1